MQNKTLRLKPLVFSLSCTQICWSIIIYLIKDDFGLYLSIDRPWYAPPIFIIILISSITFLILGISSYLMITSRISDISVSMYYYVSAIALMLSWFIIFFKFSSFKLSIFIVILCILDLLITSIHFYDVDPIAGILISSVMIWYIYIAIINGKIIYLQQIAV